MSGAKFPEGAALVSSTVYVSPFTMQGDQLAVALRRDEHDHLVLPSTPLLKTHAVPGKPMLETAAEDALSRQVVQDAPLTAEPLLTQAGTAVTDPCSKTGFMAALRFIKPPKQTDTVTLVPLQDIANASIELPETDQQALQAGLERLQPPKNVSWGVALGLPESVIILSRLVRDPHRFTLDELRIAYRALLYSSLQPGQTTLPELERANFSRAARNELSLIEVGQTVRTKGRPAGLWSMPQGVLESTAMTLGPVHWPSN
jgi:hypothetical protein